MGRRGTDVDEGPAGAATSYDVARRAGVSQSAVSRCFKPGASVAPATRARILAAAEALGYAPNAIAQGLITRRSNMVAVLISSLTNLIYPEVLSQLTERLSERGVRLLLFTLHAEFDAGEVLSQVLRYRVDGVIAAAQLSEEALERFAARGVPVVLYNRRSLSGGAASVSCDHVAGERLLIDRLIASGHQRFGIISGPADNAVSQERVGSAVGHLRGLGLTFETVAGRFDYESGAEGLARLLEQARGGLDAVVCANDTMAMGAMDRARTLGRQVPQDLSIVGFDGVEPATWSSYALTTIRQPVDRMTEAAVAMLIERIEQPELAAEHRLFAGRLVEGASARL